MKILRRLKNKKGFTLVELIVGIIIFAIISLAVSMLLTPTLFAYMRANDFAEYNSLLDNIANQIISDLSQSTAPPNPVPATDAVTIITRTRNFNYIVNADGVLQLEGVNVAGNPEFFDVFTADFYKRKRVSFTITADPAVPFVYLLTVTLTGDDGQGQGNQGFEISRDYAVRPIMLNQG